MKPNITMILFFAFVLLIYLLGNYYVFARGQQALPQGSGIKTIYGLVFWFLAASFVAGRLTENVSPGILSDVLVWTGSFWLAIILYFFLAVLLIDIIRISARVLPVSMEASWIFGNKARVYIMAGIIPAVLLIVAGGFINSRYPVVRNIEINIGAKVGFNKRPVNAVLLSDIHLGTIVGKRHLERIADRVMQLEPDIIFLAGDILDEDVEPVIRRDIGEALIRMKAPLGVYAVMGNHEYIGGASRAARYLKDHGIILLRDSVVLIEDLFYLIGREDRDKKRFGGEQRKPLASILEKTDQEYPVIVIDHQPYSPEEAAMAGADLQLSGHTHHGQLWPLNYITRAIYPVSHGYGRINGMHLYVSAGVGTWGPPVRIGNRPEIVHIDISIGK